jgi:hypothetical protein
MLDYTNECVQYRSKDERVSIEPELPALLERLR